MYTSIADREGKGVAGVEESAVGHRRGRRVVAPAGARCEEHKNRGEHRKLAAARRGLIPGAPLPCVRAPPSRPGRRATPPEYTTMFTRGRSIITGNLSSSTAPDNLEPHPQASTGPRLPFALLGVTQPRVRLEFSVERAKRVPFRVEPLRIPWLECVLDVPDQSVRASCGKRRRITVFRSASSIHARSSLVYLCSL